MGVQRFISIVTDLKQEFLSENLNESLEATYFVYGYFDYLLLDEIRNVDCSIKIISAVNWLNT